MIYMILVYDLSAIIIWKMILTIWFIYFDDFLERPNSGHSTKESGKFESKSETEIAPIKMGMDGISHQSRDSFFSKPFPDQLWIHV